MVVRRGRRKTVCARDANLGLSGGRSTSPLAVTMKHCAVGTVVAMLSAVCFATASEPLATGEYGTDDGMGTLVISSGSSGKQAFRLTAQGVNGHRCGFSGTIENGIGRVDLGTPDEPLICAVSFERAGNALSVGLSVDETKWEQCRPRMCGARAGFEGSYFLLPAPCTASARGETRAHFLHAFRAGDYQQAAEVFERLQTQCARFLDWFERDQVHNNLAMALHRLNLDSECLRELSKTEAASAGNELKLREHFVGAPFDFERYLPVARTTWKVQRACGGSNS